MTVQASLMEASIKTQCKKTKQTALYSLFEHKYVGSFLFLWKVQHKMFSWR